MVGRRIVGLGALVAFVAFVIVFSMPDSREWAIHGINWGLHVFGDILSNVLKIHF